MNHRYDSKFRLINFKYGLGSQTIKDRRIACIICYTFVLVQYNDASMARMSISI